MNSSHNMINYPNSFGFFHNRYLVTQRTDHVMLLEGMALRDCRNYGYEDILNCQET